MTQKYTIGLDYGTNSVRAMVAGIHKDFAVAQKKMTRLKAKTCKPNPKAHDIYRELYSICKTLHDAFGTRAGNGGLYDAMKRLINIRNRVRK